MDASPGLADALFRGGGLCIDLIDGNKIETAMCLLEIPSVVCRSNDESSALLSHVEILSSLDRINFREP